MPPSAAPHMVPPPDPPRGAGRHGPSPETALPAPADPDADLAVRAAAGERAAFEALLRRHYDRMHRLAWRLTGTRADADDLVQEVCCGLVTAIGGFRGEARFTTWLTGIVVNAARDHHRRRASLLRFREGLAVLVGLASGPDGRDLHRRAWLASALGRLDPSLRETIALVVGEGLTHAEAARALGLAETTVSWRLHEARRLLKDTRESRQEGRQGIRQEIRHER